MKSNTTAYINAKIFTSNDDNLYCEAMIISDGKIQWIGKMVDMPEGEYDKVDLQGKRVLPGFVDSHMHPIMLADFSKKISALPPVINSLKDLSEKIKEVRENQEAGQWIEGWGYDEGKLDEKRSPNRYDLDAGCNDSPVRIFRTCGHVSCVNSKALEIAGITKDTPDPEGGEIMRDENGKPTGVLRENARTLIEPFTPVSTKAEVIDQVIDLGELLSSQGITGIADMGFLSDIDVYGYYKEAAEKGFQQRVGIYYMWNYYWKNKDFSIPKEQMNLNNKIHVAGLKLVGDGSVSGRTAWVKTPYIGTDECGIMTCSDELMNSAIEYCKENKCQFSMHAMGERTIDKIVNRVSQEEKWTEGNVPHLRIEHITEPSEEAIKKTVENGFAFVTQPIFLYAEIESYLTNLGAERTKTTYPVKSLLEKGVNVALSTDAPATSWAIPSDPFPNLKCAVTRVAYDGTDCGQDERIDIETAIKLYTRNSAEVLGLANTGQLKAGYNADFIVLNEDILNVKPESIDEIKVEQTYIEGKKVYERK